MPFPVRLPSCSQRKIPFYSLLILIFLILTTTSCQSSLKKESRGDIRVPEWAKNAIWYQIFPERFNNGDPDNDPTIETLEGTWPYEKQSDWHITPWTDDWYKLQPWEKQNARGFYYNAQLRRYGGDLQGIIDKLDYLQVLGINALYLNPIFESPSSHKYGCAMYHHVDNNFGPDPARDEAIWKLENPADPSTWLWTTADSLFLRLITEVHQRNMKIIIDGVFNHVGIPFWAFQDVKRNGRNSPFFNWFIIEQLDNPQTPENEFRYRGWFDVPDLPEIKEGPRGAVESFRNHIKAIVKRWMDPNGDGDPSDGIDGWRLDVADMVNINFWHDFNRWVKSINPEAYLTAEVWWEDYNRNIMYDASPWLNDSTFDAVMNYRFGDAMLKAFVNQQGRVSPSQLNQLLNQFLKKYPPDYLPIIQNVIDSHDTERLASMVKNPDRWIDHGGNLQYNLDFDISKPGQEEKEIIKTILLFQFTFIGAPYIYYGDEAGMWGADDPDCRKPMVWPELSYEPESHHPFNLPRPIDPVFFDRDLFRYYQSLTSLRKKHPALRSGSFNTFLIDDNRDLFGFERKGRGETIRAVFNLGLQDVPLSLSEITDNSPKQWVIIAGEFQADELSARKGVVLLKR